MSERNEPKIGAGHADAMFRQGLAELRAALYPESNVAQPPQLGLYGTATQREVYDGKQANTVEGAPGPSGVGEPQVQPTAEQDREPPASERE